MHFDDSVHNGNVSFLDLEHDDLPRLDGVALIVGEEEEVSTVKGRLHTAAERETERQKMDGSLIEENIVTIIMPRGGATAYGSRAVCHSVRTHISSLAENQALKLATQAEIDI